MPIPRREDPFQVIVRKVRERRIEHAQELAIGKWTGEPQARELVGRIKALDDIESEMTKLTAPGSHYTETDV